MIPRPLRPFTRIVWLLVALSSLAVFLYVTAAALLEPLPDCTVPSAECQAVFYTRQDAQLAEHLGLASQALGLSLLALASLARLSLALVGVIIFLRRPDDWVAWLMSVTLTSVFAEGAANLPGWLEVAHAGLYLVGVLFFVPLPFLFPNGRLVPRWTRWLVWPLAVATTVATLWAPNTPIYGALYLVWLGLSPVALVYRYVRAATPTERQQIKWVVAGFVASFVIAFNWIFIVPRFPPWEPSPERLAYMIFAALIYVAGYGGLALALGFSILRYRLWEIDVLVRRTLTYTVLTGLLALVYLGSVVAFQRLLRGVIGSEAQIASVLSTLLIAALFVPLRGRVQRAIDRRFYRRKYDAALTLAAFAARARDETNLERLSNQLVATVEETMQPASASLWLKDNRPA
jgi:hypothetical protein